jgi:hypothetical protein
MKRDGFSALALELSKAAKGLDRKLNELQKGVMEIRMIPVGQLFEKMSRIVRKISREQGKKVELKTFGADTELDKLIIEDISDPMMHIIRNSIDHGIETPEERVRQDTLLNVLVGHMSFIGPRPERPEFVQSLQKEIPYYMKRLSVKPGITGWAQVKYRYGASVEDSIEKLQYDLYYIKNLSLFLDLLILLNTVQVVLFARGR